MEPAGLMLKPGIHANTVVERLGHAGVVIPLETYYHVLPRLHQAVARAFDDGLNGHQQSNPDTAGVQPLSMGADLHLIDKPQK